MKDLRVRRKQKGTNTMLNLKHNIQNDNYLNQVDSPNSEKALDNHRDLSQELSRQFE